MAFLDFRKLLKKDLIRNKHKIQPLEQQAAMDAGSFEGFYYTFFNRPNLYDVKLQGENRDLYEKRRIEQ